MSYTTLDTSIVNLFNTNWNIGVIDKPSFFTSESPPRAHSRILFVYISNLTNEIAMISNDGKMFASNDNFEIHGWESTQAECDKCVNEIKKILLTKSVGGLFFIKSYTITDELQLKKYRIDGYFLKATEAF